MSDKVEITLYGKRALVDKDQVKMLVDKEAAVKEAVRLQDNGGSVEAIMKLSSKIIRLNRKIRQNVIFI